MAFYEEFNKYYDYIFPTGKPQLDFITKRIVGNRILDIACGTGNYSIPLAESGYAVSAVDLDEGMIEVLKGKAQEQGLDVKAVAGDMKKLSDYFAGESFQTAFCIGNSLVHIKTPEEILGVLKDIYHLLQKDGRLILQIINYDRIIANEIEGLPTIENSDAGISLIRNYSMNNKGLINFNTELIIKKENKWLKNTVALYPLKSKELTKLLEEAGFSVKELYGSFKEDPYSQEAYGTIVVAERK